jgi:hypothetical protein
MVPNAKVTVTDWHLPTDSRKTRAMFTVGVVAHQRALSAPYQRLFTGLCSDHRPVSRRRMGDPCSTLPC